MRVLNLSLDRSALEAGSAVQTRLLALSEKVGEMTVLVPAGKGEVQKPSEHLTVYAVEGNKLLQFFKLWSRGMRMLSQRKYDLITVQDAYFVGFLAVQLGKKFSVPVEVQVHGLEKFSSLRERIAGFVLNRATRIRVVSRRLGKLLDSRFKIQDSRIYLLPVYTQVDIPEKLGKRKTVPYPFTFLTVGRLVPVKNIGLQIRAFAKLAKKIPHIKLRIVGDGEEMERLKSEARSSKFEDKIVFEGEQKEVGKYYEEADAFLLTSDYEGWGRVVLEASAYKLPIIMTNVGLALEVIKNEESGLIIPVGDEQELVRAMQDLLDKPELRAKLGEGAYRAFCKLPSKEDQIEKQVTEWQVLIDRK
ncbi:MAG: glycosyltransferase [bacterium]|nr:glycosyltransferase [bacterium]